MKIVSWNVNSIKARLEHVKRYLAEEQPDVLMIQELKGLEFPTAEFLALGYQSHAVGQKAYNGVAMLSKHPIHVVAEKLDGSDTDEQARYLEADVNGVRLINIYLPNGNPVPGDKYDYKLAWMKRLYHRLKVLCEEDKAFVIGGDFNIIPEAKDAKNPKDWEQDALYRIESRRAFRTLLNLGLYDAFRCVNSSAGQYTFWDYQAGAWQKNNGIRIDHFLLTAYYTDRIKDCKINKTPRGWDSTSDHTPIELTLHL
jgi:exodeoxyribonuclease-3